MFFDSTLSVYHITGLLCKCIVSKYHVFAKVWQRITSQYHVRVGRIATYPDGILRTRNVAVMISAYRVSGSYNAAFFFHFHTNILNATLTSFSIKSFNLHGGVLYGVDGLRLQEITPRTKSHL